MARAHRLHGLAFAAIRRAPKRPIFARANRVATVPEFRGDAAVARSLDHPTTFAVLDLPADFRGELKMVTAVGDGPRAICFHINSAIGAGNQVVEFAVAGQNA